MKSNFKKCLKLINSLDEKINDGDEVLIRNNLALNCNITDEYIGEMGKIGTVTDIIFIAPNDILYEVRLDKKVYVDYEKYNLEKI